MNAPILVALFVSTAALAGDATLRTRDGRVLKGRVLQETSKGFLLRTDQRTELVEYANVDDLSYEGEARSAEAPPPSMSADATVVREVPAGDWVEQGRGFRIGIGLSPVFYPGGIFDPYYQPISGGVGGQFHLNFGLGRVDVRSRRRWRGGTRRCRASRWRPFSSGSRRRCA